MAQSAEDLKRAYSVFLAKVWTDPSFKSQAESDPAAALRQSGVDVPEGVNVELIAPTGSPDLGNQLGEFESASAGDTVKVVVPPSPPDSVQAPAKIAATADDGNGTSYCCCCCPSCSCT